MKALTWLSKTTAVSAGLLLAYFIFEVIILLVQYQLVAPHTKAFYQYLQLSSLYIFLLALLVWLIKTERQAGLCGYILLTPLVFFMRSGARWVVIDSWSNTGLINSIWYYGYWATLVFFAVVTIIYFLWLYNKYKDSFLNLPSFTYVLATLLIVLIIPLYLIGLYYTIWVLSPILFMTTPTIELTFWRLLPEWSLQFLGLLAAWAILSKRYYILLIHVVFAPYYLFLSKTSAWFVIQHHWGEFSTLSLAGHSSGWSLLIFFVMVISTFFIWLYEHGRINNQ